MATKQSELSNDIITPEINDTLRSKSQTEVVEQKEKFPHIQLLNPRDSIEDILEENKPYGVFFPGKNLNDENQPNQIERFGFVPDANWTKINYRFNPDKPARIEGYQSFKLRCVWLNIGQPFIEGKKADGSPDYLGNAYEKGKPTEAYKSFESNRTAFKMRTRTHILPIYTENKIMSNSDNLLPVTFTWSAGIAACLGQDLRWYYTVFDQLLRQALGEKHNNAYGFGIRNKFIVDIELGLRKLEGGSNFLVPKKILVPTLTKSQIGTKGVRKLPAKGKVSERIVELEYVSILDLLIREESETALLIDHVYERHIKPLTQKQPQVEVQEEINDVVIEEENLDHIPF